ncbi:NAD(P)/FAD-dependent oxidoreductase [Alphaproteobacteria bacterium LSUCC0684]
MAQSPSSIYADTIDLGQPYPPPEGDQQVDVAVVGGGFTGVSTALNLRERGYRVHLYEAERIGYGASGRNGGQLCQGWTTDFAKIARRIPPQQRRMAWEVGMLGREIVIDRCRRHNIDADLKFGYLHAALHRRQLDELNAMQKEWEDEGYEGLTFLADKEALAPHIASDAYIGGLHDAHSGHLQPLKYLHGLARAAVEAGVIIHEGCRITRITPGQGGKPARLEHDGGVISADRLVLAGNAYLGKTAPRLMDQRIAPVTSAIIATAPLSPNLAHTLLPGQIAVADCNTALNYFRIDADGRMLFGGRASYLAQESGAIRADLSRRMTSVFPALSGVEIDSAWSGRIGITVDRIPHFGKIGETTWFVQGFSGHGVAFTGVAALILAEAIDGDTGRFDTFAAIRHLPFPGGIFRTPALALGMAWFKLRDKLRI